MYSEICQCTERVPVSEGCSQEFEVKVRVHLGSVVLEALSSEFCIPVPWENLYAYDLVIIADSL